MRRDPGDHPNGLIDFALCSTIEHLRSKGAGGLSLNFAAFRSVLDGERGEGTFTRVERWALKRLSGILPIESLWTFNSKYHPRWLPRHLVYPAAESFVPVVAAVLRAESMTEIPVIGRFLTNDPTNRPGTVVPEEVLAAAKRSNESAPR
jgi:lysyl-tRNA synthetase class 2